ncbi:UNVERIFIED_CONTAM: hypothetical protein Sangu_2984700 [Sesamum angustifolium]|uniref:Uncharacterized protein n=1 Tax=Sesamum angustifolium TaxID=2727405 RepID=A0AAW2IHY9_9LAMI
MRNRCQKQSRAVFDIAEDRYILQTFVQVRPIDHVQMHCIEKHLQHPSILNSIATRSPYNAHASISQNHQISHQA